MSSFNEPSSSSPTTKEDDDTAETLEQKYQNLRALLSGRMVIALDAARESKESDKSPSSNSPPKNSPPDNPPPSSSPPNKCDEPDDKSSPKNHTTKEADDNTHEAIAQQEDPDPSATFSWLIYTLIEHQLHATEGEIQRRQAPRPNHFEENTREEALIMNAIAGPNATPAEKQQLADEAAEVRQDLVRQSLESVAQSMARAAEEAREARVIQREADEYERELHSMKRLVGIAMEGARPGPGEGEGVGGLAAFERMSLGPLRGILQGPSFQALKDETGSFDEAVERLFEMMWGQKKENERLRKAEERERERERKDKGKGKGKEKAEGS
ncbi:hypothetical protein VP1G_04972 [Cytospora mali]|uniref:Uncharacterized protein n=1 Tax=Cytospora mali TaxID=578113 RepID=A0A194V192_CYTMA|nr:hypothetical protein VP1G_04972 [Valsa mali var. pyri (nom. inval.)]